MRPKCHISISIVFVELQWPLFGSSGKPFCGPNSGFENPILCYPAGVDDDETPIKKQESVEMIWDWCRWTWSVGSQADRSTLCLRNTGADIHLIFVTFSTYSANCRPKIAFICDKNSSRIVSPYHCDTGIEVILEQNIQMFNCFFFLLWETCWTVVSVNPLSLQRQFISLTLTGGLQRQLSRLCPLLPLGSPPSLPRRWEPPSSPRLPSSSTFLQDSHSVSSTLCTLLAQTGLSCLSASPSSPSSPPPTPTLSSGSSESQMLHVIRVCTANNINTHLSHLTYETQLMVLLKFCQLHFVNINMIKSWQSSFAEQLVARQTWLDPHLLSSSSSSQPASRSFSPSALSANTPPNTVLGGEDQLHPEIKVEPISDWLLRAPPTPSFSPHHWLIRKSKGEAQSSDWFQVIDRHCKSN